MKLFLNFNHSYIEYEKLAEEIIRKIDLENFELSEKKYLDFLKLMHEAAINIETEGENIELFLFIFGNNLKEI